MRAPGVESYRFSSGCMIASPCGRIYRQPLLPPVPLQNILISCSASTSVFCASARGRTWDLSSISRMLYQLSYARAHNGQTIAKFGPKWNGIHPLDVLRAGLALAYRPPYLIFHTSHSPPELSEELEKLDHRPIQNVLVTVAGRTDDIPETPEHVECIEKQ